MIMMQEVTPSTLDSYERGIRNLVTIHGAKAWPTIMVADETVRGEQWDILRETLAGDAVKSKDSTFIARKWETVISKSAFGSEHNEMTHWWYLHVTAPLGKLSAKVAGIVVDAVEGVQVGSQASNFTTWPTQFEVEKPDRGNWKGKGQQKLNTFDSGVAVPKGAGKKGKEKGLRNSRFISGKGKKGAGKGLAK